MADHRRFADHSHGQVGSLVYKSQDLSPLKQPKIARVRSSRQTWGCPELDFLGPVTELYGPSNNALPDPSTKQWAHRQTQKKWLLKAHPIAGMGNPVLEEYLRQDHEHFRALNDEAGPGPLVAIGHIARVENARTKVPVQVLAAAAGESGHVLRIAPMVESEWHWGDSADAVLSLATPDPDEEKEEAMWADDALPITAIKFAASASPDAHHVRWILVQKKTSTTILQPEYHQVPVTPPPSDRRHGIRAASRIDACPVLSISHGETGGNAHVDVVPSPGSRECPPQIIVLDECGYWTVWSIAASARGRGTGYRKELVKCGHVSDGILQRIPQPSPHRAETHGMLLVGEPYREDKGESDLALARPRHLLLWSQEKFVVVDLASDSFLPSMADFTATKQQQPDYIVAVQPSASAPGHVFVLTLGWLFLVDVQGPSLPQPRILAAAAHPAARQKNLRMTVSSYAEGDSITSLVILYSPGRRQITTFWFTTQPERDTIISHSSTTSLPATEPSARPFQVGQLHVSQANFRVRAKNSGRGVGSAYHEAGVRFFQGKMLGKDLSLQDFVIALSPSHNIQPVLPQTRAGWSDRDREKARKKKQKLMARVMGEAFVFPDSTDAEAFRDEYKPSLQPKNVKILRFCNALSTLLLLPISSDSPVQAAVPLELIRKIKRTIQAVDVFESFPLLTWKEVGDDLSSTLFGGKPASADAVEELFRATNAEVIVTNLDRVPQETVTHVYDLANYYADVWLKPIRDDGVQEKQLALAETWIQELSRDVFLSISGLLIQRVPLFGPGTSESQADSQRDLIKSSPSRSSRGGVPSTQPASSPVPQRPVADPVLERLSLLARGIDAAKMGSDQAKASAILLYWPSERGVDTKDYVSSVAMETDKRFEKARQRSSRAEARRKAQADKIQRSGSSRAPRFYDRLAGHERLGQGSSSIARLPQITPAATQIMSSQQQIPGSSQPPGLGVGVPGFTMSQPISGAFADRKRSSKKASSKKKSGFR